MVSIEDLRKIFWLEKLTNRMLEKLSPHTKAMHLEERDVVFEEGDRAETFYMLNQGKVLLEVELSNDVIVSLGSVRAGFSFGWSALLPGSTYTSYARCVEPCEVFAIPGHRFLEITDEDHTMGYIVMQGLVRILENRLIRRTEQLLKVMARLPDIQKILAE